MFDTIIANGTIVDGTGSPPYNAELGISGDTIVAIGQLSHAPRRTTIDASGLHVVPGFIDIHTHSDLACLSDRLAESKLLQGVTTEICGNCGSSAAPLAGEARSAIASDLAYWGVTSRWSSVAEYLELLQKRPPAVNIGTFAGHGTIRAAVMGYDDRHATAGEIAAMRRLLQNAIADGAFGLSTGLYYAPGCYSEPGEVTALLHDVAATGTAYVTHLRSEAQFLRQALAEAITAATTSGARLHISHLKAAGKMNWGLMPELLSLLNSKRSAGSQITCDVYPYDAGHTTLVSLLPPFAQRGGVVQVQQRLRERSERDKTCAALAELGDTWDNLGLITGWDRIFISRASVPGIVGKDIAAIAGTMGLSSEQAVCELIVQGQARAGIVVFMMDDADVATALKWEHSVVGSDATAITRGGPGERGRPHPRAYGTFPRVFSRYVRTGQLTVETAVNKMTGMAAEILNLTDRGHISTGYRADITILDLDQIADTATYDDPIKAPRGINRVFVNGQLALEKGALTGNLAGRPLYASRR